MKIKISKQSIYYIVLFIYCFIDLNFFYLIDSSTFNFFGIYYTDFVFLLNIGLVVFEVVKNRGRIMAGINIKVILILITIAFTSAIAGIKAYNQPFLLGLVAQRGWISCILMFYPILSWLKKGKITVNGLKNMLYMVATIYVPICILQYVFAGTLIFTFVPISSRYSDSRMYFDVSYLTIVSAFALDDFLGTKEKSKKKLQLRYVFLLAAIAFIYIIVIKGRMAVLALTGAVSICFMLHSQNNVMKKVIYCVILIIVLACFMNTTMGKDIITILFNSSSKNDTLSIRNDGRVYYMSLLLSSVSTFIFGLGSPNINWEIAQRITNPAWNDAGTARFYLSDQGILGVTVCYGVLGVIVWVFILIFCLRVAYKIYKRKGRTAYLQYILIEIIGCATLTPNFFYTILVFPIFFAMLLHENGTLNEENRAVNI